MIFWKLNPEIFWGMAHWLGRKRKKSIPRIMQEYRKESTLGYKGMNLVMPTDVNARKRLVKAWHNPYTAKEAIVRERFLWYERLWIGTETRQGSADLREELILLKGTVCALQWPGCESNQGALHPSEVEMDHIIPRAKFKDLTEADRMSNLQPVCSSCHRAKTKSDLKVLSRMR